MGFNPRCNPRCLIQHAPAAPRHSQHTPRRYLNVCPNAQALVVSIRGVTQSSGFRFHFRYNNLAAQLLLGSDPILHIFPRLGATLRLQFVGPLRDFLRG